MNDDVASLAGLAQAAVGIAVYGLIVNAFYQIMSRRQMFASRLDRAAAEDVEEAVEEAQAAAEETEATKELAEAARESHEAALAAKKEIHRSELLRPRLWRQMGYFLLVPVVSFGYFFLLSASLIVLSDAPVVQVLELAMGIVIAVRVTAYISQPTSNDLAKMLPLALLGFFLVSSGFGNLLEDLADLEGLVDAWRMVAGGIAIVLALELLLGVIHIVVKQTRWRRIARQ